MASSSARIMSNATVDELARTLKETQDELVLVKHELNERLALLQREVDRLMLPHALDVAARLHLEIDAFIRKQVESLYGFGCTRWEARVCELGDHFGFTLRHYSYLSRDGTNTEPRITDPNADPIDLDGMSEATVDRLDSLLCRNDGEKGMFRECMEIYRECVSPPVDTKHPTETSASSLA
jgi:hypothetical protein